MKTKSKKSIGIDLGSYNSAVSIYEGNEVKIIPNSEGGLTTPSIIAFTKDGVKVGESAKRQAALNPKNTIFNIKRLMGKTYDQVKHLKRPYEIVNNNGRAAVKVNDKIYSPEELSAIILQKMKKTAEEYLGEEVERAIITVPAHFNSDERESTKIAGEIAGFKVERIIAEPTAAVLNVDNNKSKKYAVYDFGGQTTDFSIVDVGDGVFEILSTDGDLDLGGSLIDEAIVNYLADDFKKDNNIDLRKDPMAHQRLFEAAEKAKIELSNNSVSDINLPYITAIDGVPKHLVSQLTKSKFEQLSENIINKTIEKAKSALEKSGLKITDIDEVLLVGGSSRIPLAQEKLEKFFNKKPSKALNPDTCVSTGACIQGGVISGEVNDILLLDVVPLSISLETLGGIATKMIEANTTIPTTKSQVFSTAMDNQPSVEIHVLQGERAMAKDNKTLGRFHLDGISPQPKGVPQIEVGFSIDVNGIVSVSAKDKATGKEQSIKIENSSLSKEEIEKMKNEAKLNEDSDKKAKEEVDVLNKADSLIFQTEKQIKEFGDKLSIDQKEKLTTKVNELKELYGKKDLVNLNPRIDELSRLWNEITTEIYKNSSEQDKVKENKDLENVEFEEVK